ncbi:MAG: ribosome silencing factor [Acidobacteriota bacterium]|nr:ribosome silencing factor [Blastocatellia bacterium]MDW8240289.1 ribosome silencing factor [Acidobacteriota bacterium]
MKQQSDHSENMLMEVNENLVVAAKAALEKKALRLTALDLRNITSIADAFLICSGTSNRQVQAIADAIIDKLRAAGSRPMHVEGYDVAEWILIDYGYLVVHVFSERARDFYDLERLWRDGARIEIQDVAP